MSDCSEPNNITSKKKIPGNKRRAWVVAVVVLFAVIFMVGGSAAWEYHEKPEFCVTCHLMQPYLDSWTGEKTSKDDSPLLANLHATSDEEIECLDCHPSEIKEQVTELVAFITGDYRAPLEQRIFEDQMCLDCHENREAIIELTADYELDYSEVPAEMLVQLEEGGYDLEEHSNINPHAQTIDPFSIDPHAEGGEPIACSNCHVMHRNSPEIGYCYSCHHSGTFAPCNVCHE